jgi:hypothetical protein
VSRNVTSTGYRIVIVIIIINTFRTTGEINLLPCVIHNFITHFKNKDAAKLKLNLISNILTL